MSAEHRADLKFEIGHVLFVDIVGYSKLLINEQSDQIRKLKEIVRGTEQVHLAEADGKLLRLPTGDGAALVFRNSAEAPVLCALEISKELKKHPELRVRMGIHSGPVNEVSDLNAQANIAGAGINIAQRVMDCGEAGHILLSKRVSDDLEHYPQWRSQLHDLGECEVKHGAKIDIANLYTGDLGNPAIPEKLKKEKQIAAATSSRSQSLRNALLIATVLLLAFAFWFVFQRTRQKSKNSVGESAAHVSEKRIAVLPFKSLLPENRDQVLELGMADTLIAKLGNSREIIVSSLNAVRKYGALEQDSLVAGRELQVNSVLEGNVQKAGDRIRVTARLINVADGSSLWAATFDEKFTDVFAVQDAISQKVADALALRLSGEEKNRLTKRYTENVEAYQLYLTGRYHFAKLIPPEIRTAMGFYQRAIALDPNYALAYFGLAEANRSLAINADVPAKDCLPQAKAAAIKAIELDDSLAEAHASLSFSLIWYDWQWAAAETEAKRPITLNPNSAVAHFSYGHVLSDLARHEEATTEGAQAISLDPVFPLFRAIGAMFLHHAGRNDEAYAVLQKALELEPNFWITHLILGKVLIQQRKYAEAIAEFDKAKELSHGNSEAIGSIGYAAALAGDTAKARAVLDELNSLSTQHYIPPFTIALVYTGLGEQNESLSWLEKGIEDHDVRLTLLEVDPRWDALRSNPRFLSILKRIGLR